MTRPRANFRRCCTRCVLCRQALAIGANGGTVARAARARAAANRTPRRGPRRTPRGLAACGARRPAYFTDPAERRACRCHGDVALKAPWTVASSPEGKWRLATLSADQSERGAATGA